MKRAGEYLDWNIDIKDTSEEEKGLQLDAGSRSTTFHHQLNLAEKWNIIALVLKEYNPEKFELPDNIWNFVSCKVHKSPQTVQKIYREYN